MVIFLPDFVVADAAVATLSTTAYSIIRLRHVKARFYFVQDYEPLFYPAGTSYGLAEATYRLGFRGICNTYPLKQLYEEHGRSRIIFCRPSILRCFTIVIGSRGTPMIHFSCLIMRAQRTPKLF